MVVFLNTTNCTDLRSQYDPDTGMRIIQLSTDSDWNEDDQILWAETAEWLRTTLSQAEISSSMMGWWDAQDDDDQALFKCNHNGTDFSKITVTKIKSTRLLEEKLALFNGNKEE